MRHGAVAYFDDAGRPVVPETVPLTDEGRTRQRRRATCSRTSRSTA